MLGRPLGVQGALAVLALLAQGCGSDPSGGSDPGASTSTGSGGASSSASSATGGGGAAGGASATSSGTSSGGAGGAACEAAPLSGFGPLTLLEAEHITGPVASASEFLIPLPGDRLLGRASRASSIADYPDPDGAVSMALAQGAPGWARHFTCGVHAAALSTDGAKLLVGGSLSFDCHDGEAEFKAVSGAGNQSVYVASYDAATGARLALEVRALPHSRAGTHLPNGNILLAGRFSGSDDFGAGPVSIPGGGFGLYLAEYDLAAKPVAVHTVPGNLIPSVAASDASGNLFVGGYARSGDYDFGEGSTTDRLWVASFAAGGALRWARTIKGNTSSHVLHLAASDSGVAAVVQYANGQFNNEKPVDFGAGPVEGSGRALVSWDPATGALRGLRRLPEALRPRALAVSPAGEIALTAQASESLDAGGGTLHIEAGADTAVLANYASDVGHVASHRVTPGCGKLESTIWGVAATAASEFVTRVELDGDLQLPGGKTLPKGPVLLRWSVK